VSFHRPKLCPNASWNSFAQTFADSSIVGVQPYGLFVNANNSVFVANRQAGHVIMWQEGIANPKRNISGGLNAPYSVFATDSGDVYIDNGKVIGRLDKWTPTSVNSTPVMFICKECYGLFVDAENNIYCSMVYDHQVLSISLNTRLNMWSTVAGTGVAASTATTLYYPCGIFSDTNLDLYVADCGNDRIQKFRSGSLNGTTVVAASVPGTIALDCPSGIILDADGYMFIADSYYHRIIASGPTGFRCLFSCFGVGSLSHQLYFPVALSFDSYGNLYVADAGNNRIQRFSITSNSCGEYH
jgi:hypothetical protein